MTREEIDVNSGLEVFKSQIIICYLKFNRCDEAVKAFREAVSRLKEYYPDIRANEKWVLKVAGALSRRGKPKHVVKCYIWFWMKSKCGGNPIVNQGRINSLQGFQDARTTFTMKSSKLTIFFL